MNIVKKQPKYYKGKKLREIKFYEKIAFLNFFFWITFLIFFFFFR